jgi:hypothetical protein
LRFVCRQEPLQLRSEQQKVREIMKLKCALAGLLIVGFITPAMAEEYYVVRDTTTKKCTIITEKPISSRSVTVLGVTIFKSKSEAEGYMKKETVCTSD